MSAIARPLLCEFSLRCGAFMDSRHQTWQCPRCGFKRGFGEAETGDCTTVRA